MNLVDYDSSSSIEDESVDLQHRPSQLSLDVPVLPSSFLDLYQVEPRRGDDPTFHQGRQRSRDHVVGEWPTHVYLELWPSPSLGKTLSRALALVNEERSQPFTSLQHSTLGVDTALHISLSRPLMLTTAQKDKILAEVSEISAGSMQLTLDDYEIFANEERTRDFLVAKVSPEACLSLSPLTNALDEVLFHNGLATLYESPQFHVSFAWRAHDEQDDHASIAKLNATLQNSLTKHILQFTSFKIKVGKQIDTIALSRAM